MANFRYESLNSQGKTQTGVVEAIDRADAVRLLLSRGETATRVEPDSRKNRREQAAKSLPRAAQTKPQSPSISFRRSRRPSLSQAEMANLMRELATAIEAGLPLMSSLTTVRKQASGKAMPGILDHLIERVEAGDPLHAAARDYGPPFDEMVLGMLRAADASGDMSTVLHQLADLLERSVELRREVMGATFYPMIVAGLVVISAIILVTVLVPQLIEPLGESMVLPWPTEVVLAVANFLEAYWVYCLLGIGGTIVGIRAWLSVPVNRLLFDRVKLRLPILGPLVRDVAVARFTRTLGTLASAGLPILEALRVTQGILGNRAMMQAIDGVKEQVTAGKSLAVPLERSGLFPPLLVQVVNLGERSGRLESMLLHAAKAFDRRVETSIKLFTKALPPLLLVVMASVGGFVLAAILLPLLELQSMVQG